MSPDNKGNDPGTGHLPAQPDDGNSSDKNVNSSENGSEENRDAGVSAITCPVCSNVNRPGELACAVCGTILVLGGKTRSFPTSTDKAAQANWPTGEVIVTDQEPIIFEIGEHEVMLPFAEILTIGRASDVQTDSRPDVDLGPFGGSDKGVSRKHIKIKRKNVLIYVADLGSTNGTLLNGRRLIPNAERLLRNGDELQLGKLTIKVRF
jgi:hypothetical protein